MFRSVIIASIISLAAAGSALAASCDERASELAVQEKAKVVSVRAVGDECEIKLLVPSKDGPPVRRTFTVPK